MFKRMDDTMASYKQKSITQFSFYIWVLWYGCHDNNKYRAYVSFMDKWL